MRNNKNEQGLEKYKINLSDSSFLEKNLISESVTERSEINGIKNPMVSNDFLE